MDIISSNLSTYARDLADQGRTDTADAVSEEILSDWSDAFANLGIDLFDGDSQILERWAEGLAEPLHDWCALAMRDVTNEARYDRALDIAIKVVLPVRARMAERRRNDRSYRFTLQVLTRALCERLPYISDKRQKSEYLERVIALGDDLLETNRVQEILHRETVWATSDVNAALAVIRVGVVQREHGVDDARRINDAIVAAMAEGADRQLRQDAGDAEPIRNARLTSLRELVGRWEVAKKTSL